MPNGEKVVVKKKKIKLEGGTKKEVKEVKVKKILEVKPTKDESMSIRSLSEFEEEEPWLVPLILPEKCGETTDRRNPNGIEVTEDLALPTFVNHDDRKDEIPPEGKLGSLGSRRDPAELKEIVKEVSSWKSNAPDLLDPAKVKDTVLIDPIAEKVKGMSHNEEKEMMEARDVRRGDRPRTPTEYLLLGIAQEARHFAERVDDLLKEYKKNKNRGGPGNVAKRDH
uniref:Uncharacterized protein n=1 Tax=Meloidogyne javanica TaxID=6303 RepID=A0A915M005_MELJA